MWRAPDKICVFQIVTNNNIIFHVCASLAAHCARGGVHRRSPRGHAHHDCPVDRPAAAHAGGAAPPPKGKLGATVDQDGKSNVWVRAPRPRSPLVTSGAPFSRRISAAHARTRPSLQAVEPSMKVEKEDKGLLAFAPVALVAVGAVVAVPLLPLLFAANPDQV